jgi:hypothetical protein
LVEQIKLGKRDFGMRCFMLKINEVLKKMILIPNINNSPDTVIWINLDQENAFPIEVNKVDILKA